MIQFRRATEKDFHTVYQLINQLEDTKFSESAQLEIFKKNCVNPDIIYLIAFVDGDAAGFISCHGQWLLHHSELVGEIQEMIVNEKYRSTGLGKKLLDALCQEAQNLGIKQLEVTSNKTRTRAHQFYLREQFEASHHKFTRRLK